VICAAAAGLADLGEHQAVEWLIAQSGMSRWANRALVSLTDQTMPMPQDQWQAWWEQNKEHWFPQGDASLNDRPGEPWMARPIDF